MVIQFIRQKLLEKSTHHRAALKNLEIGANSEPLSDKVFIMPQTPQLRGMNTIIHDIDTSSEDFIFYFDRFTALLVEQYVLFFFFFRSCAYRVGVCSGPRLTSHTWQTGR